MDKWCLKCGAVRGHNQPPPSGSLMQSTYQLDKYLKHTQPSTGVNIQGVFADPSTAAYQNYAVSASLSGSVVRQDDGKLRYSWVAGRHTGWTYVNGQVVRPTDAVRFVCVDEPGKEHPFPISSTAFTSGSCDDCGSNIVY